MKNINKAELIELISKESKCTKKEAEASIDIFTDGVRQGLSKADKVTLIGFGTFYKQQRTARKGRNPRTGAELKIPAAVLPKFRAGQALKDACSK